jgi:hypothetical protein
MQEDRIDFHEQSKHNNAKVHIADYSNQKRGNYNNMVEELNNVNLVTID